MAKKKVEKDKSERWLLTYSDLMNLLLILFIILYTSSKADMAKFQQVAQSLKEGFSTMAPGDPAASTAQATGTSNQTASSATNAPPVGPEQIAAEYDQFYAEIKELLKEHEIEGKVSVSLNEQGVVITFPDNALFDPGSADIYPSTQQVVLTMGTLLSKVTYSFVLIEGHTDSVPTHNAKYIDNMGLSTQRASNVWRLLVSCGLPPEKMASIGYGEYRPVAPNDTDENRALNRRVVVSIFKSNERDGSNLSPADAIINPNS